MRRIAIATLLALLTGCGSRDARMRVFASSSMAAVFEEMAAAFASTHPGVDIDVHTGGTPLLVLQLREGAGCDVFVSANEEQMQRVVAMSRTARKPDRFAKNELAIVTAADNPHDIASLRDLTKDGLAVALCGPSVPAGKYARQALGKAQVEVQSVSDEPSVTAIISKIRLGQIDAGIVYASDEQRARPLHTVAIRKEQNVTTSCWIAPITTGEQSALGEEFTAFVLSDAGGRILAENGLAAW